MKTEIAVKIRVSQAIFFGLSFLFVWLILLIGLLPTSRVRAFSPGYNGRIAYQNFGSGNAEIHTMNLDGSDDRNLTNDAGLDEFPSWSPDGTKIVFDSDRDGDREIYIMDQFGDNLVKLTDNAVTDSHPFFSPDGTRIIFNSNRDGNSEIYIMNIDGSAPTNLSNNAGTDLATDWSQLNSRLLFYSDRDGDFDIYSMDPDGSDVTQLLNIAGIQSVPKWNADSTKIVYVSFSAPAGLHQMDPDGTNSIPFVTGSNTTNWSAYSPEGDLVIFNSQKDTPGSYELYTVESDGSNEVRLTNNAYHDAVAAIQPLTLIPATLNTEVLLTSHGGQIVFNAPANHTDYYDSIDPTTVGITNQPTKGTVSVNTTTGLISYTPDSGASGQDSFSYQICSTADGRLCTMATVGVVLGLADTGTKSTVLLTCGSSLLILLAIHTFSKRGKKYLWVR